MTPLTRAPEGLDDLHKTAWMLGYRPNRPRVQCSGDGVHKCDRRFFADDRKTPWYVNNSCPIALCGWCYMVRRSREEADRG